MPETAMKPTAKTSKLAEAVERDPRWLSIVNRDTQADGRFYYSVSTTGVYCRPSCPARLARPENVRLHATRGEAENAGFRACKRCKPDRYVTDGLDAGTVRFAMDECSLGSILVAASERGICSILMGNDPDALLRDLQSRFPRENLMDVDQVLEKQDLENQQFEKQDPEKQQFEKLVEEVVALVEAPSLGSTLPLDMRGTAFQQRVWNALREIPVGSTASYGDIAERIGAPGSVRAVARACASNNLAVVVPCHRVLRRDGGISGYRWGVERKRALLGREASL